MPFTIGEALHGLLIRTTYKLYGNIASRGQTILFGSLLPAVAQNISTASE